MEEDVNKGHKVGAVLALFIFTSHELYTHVAKPECDEYTTPNMGRITYSLGRGILDSFSVSQQHDTDNILRGLQYLDYSFKVLECHGDLEYKKDLVRYFENIT